MIKLISRFLLVISLAGIGTAQNYDQNGGFPPFVSVVKGQLDSLDLPSGNVVVELPVRTKAGKYPLAYSLVGNSHAYILPPNNGNYIGIWSIAGGILGHTSGSTFSANLGTYATPTAAPFTQCGPDNLDRIQQGWVALETNGTAHPFPSTMQIDTFGCVPGPVIGMATDGSGYTLQLTVLNPGWSGIVQTTLWDKAGNVLATPTPAVSCRDQYSCITDPDGVSASGFNAGVVFDTLNQTAITVMRSSGDQYVYNDINGNPETVQVNYTQVPEVTAFGYPNILDQGASNVSLPTSVNYPDGEKIAIGYERTVLPAWMPSHAYTYSNAVIDSNGNLEALVGNPGQSGGSPPAWNGTVGGQTQDGPLVWQNYGNTWTTGRIASLTYPQGGSVSYTYSGMNVSFGSPGWIAWPAQITRSVKDNNGNTSVWSYQIGAVSSNHSTISVTQTDPLNNVTVTNYVGAAAPGPATGSCLNSYSSLCGYEYIQSEKLSYNGPAIASNLIRTQVICYDGNNSSQTGCVTPSLPISLPISQTDVYTYPGSATSPSLLETKYDIYGNVTDVKNYDFGARYPPAGQPVSEVQTSYGSWNGSSCSAFTNNIYDRPCMITVLDASGTVSQTRYTYSSTGHPIQTATLVGGSTYLSSSANYNSNGTVQTATDVNGALSTYSYTGTGGCNSILPTSTTVTGAGLPSGGLTTSTVWNCDGGVVTSTIDPNLQSTSYGYLSQSSVADPFWRVLSTTDPLGNVARNIYSPGGTIPATQESVLLFNSNASTKDTLTTFDGLGRPIISQKRQAPGSTSFDTTSIIYDLNGRVFAVSVPCVASASQPCGSGSATTTTYDGLSRPLVVTDGGGGTTSFTYLLNDVLQTAGPAPSGENVKRKQLEYDGLGRLASVCELTGTGGGGGNCAQKNPQTGYWTKYSYDALGDLTFVKQNAQGTFQSRFYVYDGLRRLISETNPESGRKYYTYDSSATCSNNSAGDLVKTIDAMGNLTCYTYDSLHRNTTIIYRTGPYAAATPQKTFVYDASSFSCPAGANLKGRLAEAFTGPSSAKITDLGYCYSARGETTDVYESTPHSGGYYHVPMTYWANGLINTFGPFLTQDQQVYTPDGEGRIGGAGGYTGSITYNAASQPTVLQTSCNNGTCYPITYTYDPNTLRMTNYSAAITGGTISGAMNWNPNGSLQSLAITDPFNAANNQICAYSADDLDRLAGVNCGSTWAQTFSYDAFGNLTKSGSISWQPGYDRSTNHYTLGGTSYDANGNVLNDTFATYTWDAEGKNLSTAYQNGGTASFINDAFGHPVESLTNGSYAASYFRLGKFKLSAFGQAPLHSEYPLPGGSVLGQGGGGHLVYMADWLGTIRASWLYTGGSYSGSTAHAPFGESYSQTGSYAAGFAGETWGDGDPTNTTYWFPERHLRSSQGRWLSPDPAGLAAADLSNPQSWNRYAYVGNNPLNLTDPLGLCWTWAQAFCDLGQRLLNMADGEGFHTDQGVEEIAHRNNASRRQQEVSGPQGVSGRQAVSEWQAVPEWQAWVGVAGAVISRSLGGWGGSRAGKPFTPTGRQLVINRNVQQYGQPTCENCGRPLAPSTQSRAGVAPAGNEMRVDHIWPQSKLGNGDPETNGELLCSDCNLEKSDSLPMLDEGGRPATDYSEPGMGSDFQLGVGGACGPFGGEPCD